MTTQEFLAELADYRTAVDNSVRLKTAPNSVRPVDTGGRLRDVADLFVKFMEVVGLEVLAAMQLSTPILLPDEGVTILAVPDELQGGRITSITVNGVTIYPTDIDTRPGAVTYSVDEATVDIIFSETVYGIVSITGLPATGLEDFNPNEFSTDFQ